MPASRRTELPHLDGVEHRYVDAGGLRMHVAEAGEGPPLLLLHGWPQHWWVWNKVVPRLRGDFRLIMPDLRGHGWTEAPPGGYSKHQLKDDIVALLDALGLDRVPVAGHDWGGWVGFLLALEHPERVERFLGLNIPPPLAGPVDPRNLAALPRFWYQVVLASPFGPSLLRRGRFVDTMLRYGVHVRGAIGDEDRRLYVDVLRQRERAEASRLVYRTFLLHEMGRVLTGSYTVQSPRVPMRVLFGTHDAAISTRMVEGHEGIEVELTDTSGHFIPEEQPQLVADRIRAFLG